MRPRRAGTANQGLAARPLPNLPRRTAPDRRATLRRAASLARRDGAKAASCRWLRCSRQVAAIAQYLAGIDVGELAHSLERRSPGPDQCFERRDFAGRAGVDPVAEGIDDKPRDPEPERRVDEDLAIVRLDVADRFQEVAEEPGIVKNFV